MMFVLGAVYANFLTFSNFFTILLSATAVGIAGLGTMFLLISGNVDLLLAVSTLSSASLPGLRLATPGAQC